MPVLSLEPALKRYPHRPRELLQAWDSADELMIDHLKEQLDPSTRPRVLVLNDSFGALSCALREFEITSYSDSYLGTQGILQNSHGSVHPVSQLDGLSGLYDWVVLRIPKSMSFFEDILCRVSGHLRPGSQLVAGYMIKHQAKSAFDLLNRIIGPTQTSLAQKKARLIFSSFTQASAASSPFPSRVKIESFENPFFHPSNLFSREKLDIGTRFMLEQLESAVSVKPDAILDLGCANGILGISAKRLHPEARVLFSDESRMAIESAKANYASFFPGEPSGAEFFWTDCFESGPAESVKLVLCNPPFHQGNTVGDAISRRMFLDARRALVSGGVLRVVGNSHLRYAPLLRNLFGNAQVVATNRKFTIIDSTK